MAGIRDALCPNGHSLMDLSYPMGGAPSIKLYASASFGSGEVHLHPAYGNFEVETAVQLKEGELYDLACPQCNQSLKCEEERCVFCGAPMFVLRLPRGGQVHACMRKGCHNHKLKVVDLTAQLAEIFELDTRPRF